MLDAKKKMTRSKRQQTEQIEKALQRYCIDKRISHGNFPDYPSFEDWVAKKMSNFLDLARNEVALSISLDESRIPFLMFVEAFFELYTKYETRTKAKKTKPKELNKFKLLLLGKEVLGPRLSEAYENHLENEDLPEYLDESLEELSPLLLRHRLITALRLGQEKAAFKILGKLREDDHDSQELLYFEALCYFKSEDFESAIRYAKRVERKSIDYGACLLIQLESNALLGKPIEFVEELKTIPGGYRCTPAQTCYFFALLIWNSDDKPLALKVLQDFMASGEPIDAFLEADEYTKKLTRFVTKRAIEFAQEVSLWAGKEDSVPLTEKGYVLQDGEEAESTRAAVYLNILAFHPILLGGLIEAESHELYGPIVYVLNRFGEGSLEDAAIGLEAQYRLGGVRPFIDNMISFIRIHGASNQGALIATNSEYSDFRSFAYLAYKEALSLEYTDAAELIRSEIRTWPDYEQKVFAIKSKAELEKVSKRLSPDGRELFSVAEHIIDELRKNSGKWKDAGMGTLAFFRIVECEINQRIMRRFVQEISLEKLDMKISDITNKKKRALWLTFLKKFQMLGAGTLPGLELGSCALFFEKISSGAGPDSHVKDYCIEILANILSELGLRAILENKMTTLIGSEEVTKYRNAPAHGRLVTLDIAEQGRAHCITALKRINGWVREE
jgi:hypothetical protein